MTCNPTRAPIPRGAVYPGPSSPGDFLCARNGQGRKWSVLDRMTVASIPEMLTPAEVASVLKVSTDTVMRKFGKLPGVLDMGTPSGINKQRYRVIRIPRAVLERYVAQNTIK